MSRYRPRRTRPGKGRAFLKFLIGLLCAFIVCGGAYLFVLEYDRAPKGEIKAPATPEPTQTAGPEATASPTAATQTAAPDPSPAPTEEFRLSARMEGMSVPAETDDAVFGMIDFALAEDMLSLTAYLSAPGVSSEAAEYYFVASLMNGRTAAVYDTRPAENDTGLDIDLACFTGAISGGDLADGWYKLGLMAVGEDGSVYVSVSDEAYSFVVNAGKFIRYAR